MSLRISLYCDACMERVAIVSGARMVQQVIDAHVRDHQLGRNLVKVDGQLVPDGRAVEPMVTPMVVPLRLHRASS